MDGFQEFMSRCCDDIVKKEEELILSVLPKGISIIEIYKRCEWVRTQSSIKAKTLYFDGNPVLTLYDPEYETTESENGRIVIKFSQQYKISLT